MLNHGEDIFDNAQQAREVLTRHGFIPLLRLGEAEHWVRDHRHCVIIYAGEFPGKVPVLKAQYVWFIVPSNDTIDLDISEIQCSFA
ncbi:hypothetical protein LCGC14_0974270 [marine sediment metagenome]|uniref:Uncharacterized protein n=1 Tax=marine sediment metagenome TaxID=412755 RepID=A0A0F9NWU7_9ZZZZ